MILSNSERSAGVYTMPFPFVPTERGDRRTQYQSKTAYDH